MGRKAFPICFLPPGNTRFGGDRHACSDSSGIIEECAAKDIPAALIISAGFKETGPAGEKLEQEVRAQPNAPV